MRKIFLIAVVFSVAAYSSAQSVSMQEVPSVVKTKFQSLNPSIVLVKWEKEDGNFEAHYKKDAKEMTCVISPSGKYVQTETAIRSSQLPVTVVEYLSKNMPGKKITDAAEIKDASGTITYEAEVSGFDYTFDSKGNFIKKETDND